MRPLIAALVAVLAGCANTTTTQQSLWSDQVHSEVKECEAKGKRAILQYSMRKAKEYEPPLSIKLQCAL